MTAMETESLLKSVLESATWGDRALTSRVSKRKEVPETGLELLERLKARHIDLLAPLSSAVADEESLIHSRVCTTSQIAKISPTITISRDFR
jgi:hypothetical protein